MKAWRQFLLPLLILPCLFAASYSKEEFYEDGSLERAEIIKRSYGFAYTCFPFKYMKEFRRSEKEARENEGGLWGKYCEKSDNLK